MPVMMPFATDAKHTAKLGVPTYGFSPLRLDPSERFLERFHGVDERVSLDALRFGPAGPLRRGPPLLRLTRRRGGRICRVIVRRVTRRRRAFGRPIR